MTITPMREAPSTPSPGARKTVRGHVSFVGAGPGDASLLTVRAAELLAQADFVTIHMPKTPETTGMISDDQLALMKDTAFIVNVARGGLIDEDALFRMVEQMRSITETASATSRKARREVQRLLGTEALGPAELAVALVWALPPAVAVVAGRRVGAGR